MSEIIYTKELIDAFSSFLLFNTFHQGLNIIMERNLANNFTALIHASSCTAMSFSYLITKNMDLLYYLTKFTTGYFLYDLCQIIKYDKKSLKNYAYIYHHIASIYFIHSNPNLYRVIDVFFWSELSNIPSYFVYYLIKQKNRNEEKLQIFKKIQFFFFYAYKIAYFNLYRI